MGFLDKITELFGGRSTPAANPQTSTPIQAELEFAKVARRNEAYEHGLQALERAMQLADAQRDIHATTVIALHQADLYIAMGKYDTAEKLLQTIQQAAESVNQRGFMSYALSAVGTLHAKRDEWDKARQTYEQAVEVAQAAQVKGAEGRALGHLADTYIHEQNMSYAIHLLQDALAKLRQSGDMELVSYFEGRLGEATLASGNVGEGRQHLDRAMRQAENTQDRAMIRRWASALGNTAYQENKFDEATQFYERALPLYPETATAEHVDLLTRYGEALLKLNRDEQALEKIQSAYTLAKTLEDDNRQAVAEGILGMALYQRKEYAQAITYLERAIALHQNTPDGQHITLQRNLATAQAAIGEPDAAAQTYQQVIAQAQALDDPLALADVYRDYGLFLARRQQLPQAIEQWTAALNLYESAYAYNQVARVYSDLGNAKRQLGQTKPAIRDYESALVALNNVEDLITRGVVLSSAANAYTDQGDVESCAAFFKESIEIARKTNDKVAESTRLGNYAWFLIITGEARRAIEHLTQALQISRAQDDLILLVAVQTNNLGLAYNTLSQYKTALGYHEDALKILASVEPTPAQWQALFLANSARTHLSLGRQEDAATLSEQALTAARQAQDFDVLVTALIVRARVLMRQTDAAQAEPYIQEAVEITERAAMRRLKAEAYALYSEQQAQLNNTDAARTHWETAKTAYRMVGAPQAKQTPFWLGNNAPTPDEA